MSPTNGRTPGAARPARTSRASSSTLNQASTSMLPPPPSPSLASLSPSSLSNARFLSSVDRAAAPPLPSSTVRRARMARVNEEISVSDISAGAAAGGLSAECWEGLRRQSQLSTLSISPRRPTTVASMRGRRSSVKGKESAGGRASVGRSRFDESGEMMGESSSYLETMADHTLAEDADVLEETDDEAQEAVDDWTMVDRMRNWRNDAMTQHLYGTAGFWGGKVFGLTGNPNDAFWLAQTHFLTHQFAQAERLLTAYRPAPPPLQSSSSAASSSSNTRLTDTSLACRYLAAQCQVRLGKWEEALEMVGRGGNSWTDSSAAEVPSDGGVKFTASTAHLRGLIHLHLGASDLAKEAFIEALSRDVKCFESFEALVGGEMMSAEEEWNFIQGLAYQAQTGDDADFVRMMYTVRLKKVKHHKEMAIVRQRLTDEFGLSEDPDVLFGLADELYAGMRFAECYQVTTKILSIHSSHRPTLPIHLSCMHHLPHLRSRLFLLAHEMVENEPDDAISWYAVGMWYFSGRRWEESRRFFGKSVLIDSRFGPSWIAFAHSYAYEGEHDQAITAYSTALRHFQGSHLPLLFIGMQHLGLKNVGLAEEYCMASKDGGEGDAAVWNELGVVAFYKGSYNIAVEYFLEALDLSKKVQGSPAAWATTHLNLGHAYRKLKLFRQAYASYCQVIQLDPRSAAAYSGLGLVEHQLGRYQEAIARYHEALTLAPSDPLTASLLAIVLEDVSSSFVTSLPAAAPPLAPLPQHRSAAHSTPKAAAGRLSTSKQRSSKIGTAEAPGFSGMMMQASALSHLDKLVENAHERIMRGDSPEMDEEQREEEEEEEQVTGMLTAGESTMWRSSSAAREEEDEGEGGGEEDGADEGESMMEETMDMD